MSAQSLRIEVWGGLLWFLRLFDRMTQRAVRYRYAFVFLCLAVAVLVVCEVRNGRVLSRYMAAEGQKLSFRLEPGPSRSIHFPSSGPYDERLGYARLPSFVGELTGKGYAVEAQAGFSPDLLGLAQSGFFPPYREKTQAGLVILDQRGEPLYRARYPVRTYGALESVAPLIVETLLFIENREVLDFRYPHRNPAVEWDRLFRAVLDAAWRLTDKGHRVAGGSTLATQLEKMRHSPEGRTDSAREKVRQMVSATLRAYLDGQDTRGARRRIVLDYINSIPLAAAVGHGEVTGLGDGLWAWFGREVQEVNRVLSVSEQELSEEGWRVRGQAYKEVLSLFLAQRRPSYYLVRDSGALGRLSDRYLEMLYEAGVISRALRDAALGAGLPLRRAAPAVEHRPFSGQKAENAIRNRLLSLLGVREFYDLDRLDLTLKSTVNRRAQQVVTEGLRRLGDPQQAQAAGLIGPRLLERPEQAGSVLYSLTLYERGAGANLLRVQADSLEDPFDINGGAKLELGSTAKLRTLVTYLEMVADLHEQYGGCTQEELRVLRLGVTDRLTLWAIDELLRAPGEGLGEMLEAAMERRYSASPYEGFYTGGGVHTFSNFDEEEDDREPSVREAIRDSVNLVFIRLMRDMVNHCMYRLTEATGGILEDRGHPMRPAYLWEFADREGRGFLRRFYGKYQGKSRPEVTELLVQGARQTPRAVAVAYLWLNPQAGVEELAGFLKGRLAGSEVSEALVQEIHGRYSGGWFSLSDRGYLSRVHPLELWVAGYLLEHPGATLTEVVEASGAQRQEVYGWLFKTKHKGAQDSRIRTLLEREAFEQIHRSWKRQGYPFDSLVASYATAIGSSADRPAALAELMGILLNDGVRYPSVQVEELRFAEATPYETLLRRQGEPGERVLRSEVASVVRSALLEVVEKGTARRLGSGSFLGAGGGPVPVGGKTGTGDNRYEVYGPSGRLIESRVTSRTATFVFFIGERFFGTVTAYTPGPQAASQSFTSSLPVQVLKVLLPDLMPLLDEPQDDETLQAACPSVTLPSQG